MMKSRGEMTMWAAKSAVPAVAAVVFALVAAPYVASPVRVQLGAEVGSPRAGHILLATRIVGGIAVFFGLRAALK